MPIPALVDGRLPPGAHLCTWAELESQFGQGQRREELTLRLKEFVSVARGCGFAGVAVGGSYPTEVPEPGDLDLLFITPRGFDRSNLSVACAQLLVSDAAFNRRTGHNAQNCPDDEKTLNELIAGLGYDWKAGRDRGMLLLRFR